MTESHISNPAGISDRLTSAEIEALLAISEKLGASRDLSETFEQIMEILASRFGVERGALTLLESDSNELTTRVAYGLTEEEIKRGKYKIGEGITGKVVESGGPVIVPSIGQEPLFLDRTGSRRSIDRDKIAFLCVPLKLENRVIGVLSVDKVRSADDTLESDLRLLTILASTIAQAVRVHAAMAEIMELKSRSDLILAGMPDGVLVLGPSGHVEAVNEAAESIFGFRRAKVVYKHYYEVFANHADVRDIIERIYDDPKASKSFETHVFGSGSQPIPVAITWSTLDYEPSGSQMIIANIQDVTDLKRLERRLRRSQRLAALGTMAAGVAHEIRNPLGGIRGASQLLGREMKERTDLTDFIDVIVKEVDRLDKTVEQLLDLARPIKSEMTPTSVIESIDRALTLSAPEIEKKNIRVEKNLPNYLRKISADAGQLTQVFLNLFLNGIQAMNDKGVLAITARDDAISSEADSPSVVVEISDTGHGMSKQDLEHLFMPFYTTREAGTGLGLTISHRIVEEHGGAIDVVSEQGKGTTISLSFNAL